MRLRILTILMAAVLLAAGAYAALFSISGVRSSATELNAADGVVGPLAYGYAFVMKTVLQHFPAAGARYDGGETIPEPALVALMGGALLVFSKLLRKKLRRS